MSEADEATVTSARRRDPTPTEDRGGREPPLSPSDPLPRLDRFVLLSQLGHGGMGVVYAAYDERLDRKVAIKLVLPGRESEATRGRMLHEARAMARLSHPNIATVHEVGELRGQLYIAMEFIRGEDLHQWLREESRPWPRVLEIHRRAGRGLRAAHESGLIHGDFKPHNVMVGDDGSVKVLDFGLARVGDAATDTVREPEPTQTAGSGFTRTGAVMGTPVYMAPELHHGDPATARSDQFAFCVALYYGLFGRYPFLGETLAALVDAMLNGQPREPPVGSPVPPWVRRAVVRGLAREPADRFDSMGDLLDALAADPRRRRRRRMALSAVVVGVFGGGFAVAQLGTSAEVGCPDPEAALAGAWDDEQRTAVQQGLEGSGSTHAEATFGRIERVLDDYASEWVTAHGHACTSHRHGAESDSLYDQRMACLERARTSLSTLTEVFVTADATVVDKAVTAASELPDLQRCSDTEALLAALPPPPQAIASEVSTLRDELAIAKAHEDAGRMERARAGVDPVLARAAQLDYPPLLAEAQLRRGSTAMAEGHGAEADEALERAIRLAVESGHDVVAAHAASLRIYVRAELLGRPKEAAAELPWAEATVARTADDVVRGLLLNNAGAVHLRRGDLDEAIESFEASIALRRRVLPPAHPDLALSLANLGRVQLMKLRPHEAAASLEEAVERIEQTLGPRHPQRALVATIASAALSDLGRWAEAEAELELAASIYEQAPDQVSARYHVLRAQGQLALRQRQWQPAHDRFETAIALAAPELGAEHPMLVDAHLGAGRAEVALGRVEEGTARARSALQQLESSVGPDHPYVGQALLIVGEVLLAADRPVDARAAFERARQLARAGDDATPMDLAAIWISLGRAWMATGEQEEARQALEDAADALEDDVPKSNPIVIDLARAEGELEGALGLHEAAARSFSRAEAGLAATRADDDPELAWVRFEALRARAEAAGTKTETQRAAAIETAQVLARSPGWSTESATIAAWTDEDHDETTHSEPRPHPGDAHRPAP